MVKPVKPSFPVASEARTRASLEAEFTRAVTTPGLSALVGREWEALFPRFARYYQQLTRLPRRTRRTLQRQWKQSLAALALLLALGQAPALAAIIPVTTTNPNIVAGSGCSLIEAIDNANDDFPTHLDCPAGSGPDIIDLSGAIGTHTLTVVDNSTYGDTGLPVIPSAITIEGNGSTITRDGSAPAFRIFAIRLGNLTLNETTVSGGLATGGFPSDRGGGVLNSGGTVTLTNSTVSGNSAGYFGGGVLNDGGIVTLTNNTVSGNSASRGGGVVNGNGGNVTLTNSTVSGNSAASNGGGVLNGGTVILTNSTVSGNSAGSLGGGVYNYSGFTATLARTLVSGNTAPPRARR